MNLQQFLASFAQPLSAEDAAALCRLLMISSRTSRGLKDTIKRDEVARRLLKPGHTLPPCWDEIVLRHVAAVQDFEAQDWASAYAHQTALLQLFYRWLPEQSAWCLPVLFLLLKDLRGLAENADIANFEKTGNTPMLEEASRTVSKGFSLCATDRTFKGAESRRIGVYHLACLSMKCYFKVGKPNLCKNIVRAVTSDPKTPSVDTAPLSDQVMWHYYIGLLAFNNEQDAEATDKLSWALNHCPGGRDRNVELILTYLIPLKLVRGSIPSRALLSRYPRLQELFTPFIDAMKQGDIAAYDAALEWAQPRLVQMKTYLAVERAREICMRTLFKRAWVASNKESRIPISTFQTALALHHVDVVADETECYLSNMIAKDYMKGYISNERQMVVLAKTNPFPALTSIAR